MYIASELVGTGPIFRETKADLFGLRSANPIKKARGRIMSMVFCRGCGKQIHETAPTCPHCGAVQIVPEGKRPNSWGASVPKQNSGNSFQWYIEVFKKYAVFTGRARRKEYWYFGLYNFIIYVSLIIISIIVSGEELANILSALYTLATLIPSIAVGVRRLHDINRSGWWLLVPIVNLIFMCRDSQSESNRFGQNPKMSQQLAPVS